MRAKYSLLALLLMTLLIIISVRNGVHAIEINEPPIYYLGHHVYNSVSIKLLEPIADLLSGPVWLRLRGIDIYDYEPMHTLAASPSPMGALPVKLPYRVPSPKFSRNLLISIDVGRIPYQAETCIAINPRNPDNIVIGMNDYGVYGPSAYASIDGGVSWDGPFAMAPLLRDRYGSDVSLAFDREGRAYFVYMSIGFRYVSVNRIAFGDEKASIVVSRSDDGGFTWSPPRIAAIGDIYVLGNEVIVVFLDRPRIAVGPDPLDLNKDRIYVTYTEFVVRYPVIPEYPYILAPTISVTIKLTYSRDGGESWSFPKAVSPTYSYIFGEERRRIVQGSNPKVGKDGTLYVAYYDSLDDGPWEGLFAPVIVKSVDGGETFTKPVYIDYLPEMDYELPPTLFRAWVSMMPQIDVGPDGEVYMVVAAKPDDSDIFFYRSLDRGETWSTAKRVNDDRTTRDQFIPAIAVSPNGTVHISWADRRDDPRDVEYHIYYTRTGDKGERWMENVRVTDYPSNPNHGLYLYIGDYFSIAATDEDVYVSWTDTRLGKIGSPNMKIGFARTKHIPLPTILISPSTGYSGQQVKIVGENFISEGEVYIKIGDAFISVIRTDRNGRFEANIFVPTLSEGPYEVEVVDISGNRAEAYFYCETGLDTISKMLKLLKESYSELIDEVRCMSDHEVTDVNKELSERLRILEKDVNALENQITFMTTLIYVLLILLAAIVILFIIILRRKKVRENVNKD